MMPDIASAFQIDGDVLTSFILGKLFRYIHTICHWNWMKINPNRALISEKKMWYLITVSYSYWLSYWNRWTLKRTRRHERSLTQQKKSTNFRRESYLSFTPRGTKIVYNLPPINKEIIWTKSFHRKYLYALLAVEISRFMWRRTS